MDSLNMQKRTLLKTNAISLEGIAFFEDKKKQLVMIAQPKAIHVYNIEAQKFQDEIKSFQEGGSISCLTISDDLLFFACGMRIAAVIGSSGKLIFDFDTYIASDRINWIIVSGYRLWAISGNIINEFLMAGSQLSNKKSRKGASQSQKTEDASSSVLESKINACEVVEQELERTFLVVLKNSNQIVTYDGKQHAFFKTDSPPLSICRYQKSSPYGFLVGTMSGQIIHIHATKTAIKQIWSIKESKGKINCLLEVKNCNFVVFKDESMEIWSHDRTLLGVQELNQKVMSAAYIPQKEMLICGSADGQVIQMCDYMQLMKSYQHKNMAKLKEALEKQIADLRKEQALLESKLSVEPKKMKKSQGLQIEAEIVLDYEHLCYSLEVRSPHILTKLILKGDFLVLKSPKVVFEGKQDENSYIYVIEEDEAKSSKVLFKVEQKYSRDLKMKLVVYGKADKNSKTIYGTTKILEIKQMALHHKIAPVELTHYNSLIIAGEFKYFEMNLWMSSIFIDFGPSSDSKDDYSKVYYQSLVTKRKLVVMYRNGQCLIWAQNPTPLVTIKKVLMSKSQEKHISLNYSTELNLDSVKLMVTSLTALIKPMDELKRQCQLLPGLMELKNDESLSVELKKILDRKDEISENVKRSEHQHEALLFQLRECFISYRSLKEKQISKFDLENFNRHLSNFNEAKILSLILE